MMKVAKELRAIVNAMWWARQKLNPNATRDMWKKYFATLEFNIEFFLTPDPRNVSIPSNVSVRRALTKPF